MLPDDGYDSHSYRGGGFGGGLAPNADPLQISHAAPPSSSLGQGNHRVDHNDRVSSSFGQGAGARDNNESNVRSQLSNFGQGESIIAGGAVQQGRGVRWDVRESLTTQAAKGGEASKATRLSGMDIEPTYREDDYSVLERTVAGQNSTIRGLQATLAGLFLWNLILSVVVLRSGSPLTMSSGGGAALTGNLVITGTIQAQNIIATNNLEAKGVVAAGRFDGLDAAPAQFSNLQAKGVVTDRLNAKAAQFFNSSKGAAGGAIDIGGETESTMNLEVSGGKLTVSGSGSADSVSVELIGGSMKMNGGDLRMYGNDEKAEGGNIVIGSGHSVISQESLFVGTGHVIVGKGSVAFGEQNWIYGDSSSILGGKRNVIGRVSSDKGEQGTERAVIVGGESNRVGSCSAGAARRLSEEREDNKRNEEDTLGDRGVIAGGGDQAGGFCLDKKVGFFAPPSEPGNGLRVATQVV